MGVVFFALGLHQHAIGPRAPFTDAYNVVWNPMHAKYRNIDSDAVCIVCVLHAASDPVILLGCTPPLFCPVLCYIYIFQIFFTYYFPLQPFPSRILLIHALFLPLLLPSCPCDPRNPVWKNVVTPPPSFV